MMTGWLPLTGEKPIDSSFESEKMRDEVLDSESARVTYDTGIEYLRERVPDHAFEFDDIITDTAGSVLEIIRWQYTIRSSKMVRYRLGAHS